MAPKIVPNNEENKKDNKKKNEEEMMIKLEQMVKLEQIKAIQIQKICREAERKSEMIRQRNKQVELKPVMKPIPEVMIEPKEPLIIRLLRKLLCL